MGKNLLITLLFWVVSVVCTAQTYQMYQTKNYHNQLRLNTATGKVEQIQDDGQCWIICDAIEPAGEKSGRYCLYSTQNMWTFIMLDTYSGKNWQVQFSVKGEDYMFAVPINKFALAYPYKDSNWKGRFQLFETQNMWNFILLDSYDGRLWQVQYSSQDLGSLMCIPINVHTLAQTNKSVFSIQPLTSMFQYYLINNDTGEMWKFQWSTKGDDYRWIEKFN
ncbi:hypothetical protein [Phocaeicola sp.]|uniref:hypothetical protein n=1 Tax=Phocaeicola sp. TaxID=2773926 RepID=UPI00283BD34C|nr:hypothetical protein [Phocaeicola sp.]MDR3794486.1 hypothetical protein [Phocaeicola sp.]